MTDRLKDAFQYGAVKHQSQMYGENLPYEHHLIDVYAVLSRFNVIDEDLLVAAFLHDTVEDTDTTIEDIKDMFGDNVADIVGRVTNEPGKNRKERHEKTYPKIQASTDATTLKLADRIANVEFSIANTSKQIGMYKKEHKNFRSLLYKPGVHDAMWRHLDFMIGEE